MNDLKRICKTLDKGRRECGNYCCLGDNYLCAKYAVNQYITKNNGYKDKNRLLSLKSECKGVRFLESYSLLVSMVSMAICAIALLFNIMEDILGKYKFAITCFGIFLLAILIIYCIILINPLWRSRSVEKWKPYILTVIEEIEKEI